VIPLVKWPRYRPGVAQRVGRDIVLLFHDRSTRRRWVVSSKHRPHFNPGKDPVQILQEAGWAPWPVWTGEKSRPHQDSIADSPARSSIAIPTTFNNYYLRKSKGFHLSTFPYIVLKYLPSRQQICLVRVCDACS